MKSLSPRECQIIEMMIRGIAKKEIACTLGISIRTVDSYLGRVLAKTGQVTLLAAVVHAVMHGMVTIKNEGECP